MQQLKSKPSPTPDSNPNLSPNHKFNSNPNPNPKPTYLTVTLSADRMTSILLSLFSSHNKCSNANLSRRPNSDTILSPNPDP